MYSKSSIAWLNTFENLQHALNGGEVTICGAKVGFNKESNTVYQFRGCFWHGCPECYKEDKLTTLIMKQWVICITKPMREVNK